MKKKAILGLDTVKAVILVLLVLSIIAIAMFAVLLPLRTAVESIDTQSTTSNNESTVSAVLDSSTTNLQGTLALRNPVCSVSQCVNSSDGAVISPTNYTVTSAAGYPCNIKYSGPTAGGLGYNNSIWKCTYNITYDSNSTNALVDYSINSPIKLFSNVPTFFTLLGVVVIILIIAIVIIAVTRFGGPRETLQEL